MPGPVSRENPVIFVVDDQPKNLQVVGNILVNENYSLGFAQSGLQALESIRQLPPDLILLDVMMPEMDGFTVCRKLQEDPKLKHIPVIFLTAKTESEDMIEGFQSGAVDYLTKPFRPEELIARVRTHVRLKKSSEELEQLNEQKTQLMSVAAHDLKNPLAAIRGLSEILLAATKQDSQFEIDEVEQKQILTDIHQCAENTLNIVTSILNTQSIEAGKVELESEDHSVYMLLTEVVQLNSPQATKKSIQVHLDVDEELTAPFDYDRLREVVDNLLSNALKYSQPNKEAFLSAAKTADGSKLQIRVRDQGPGFTEEDREKAFQQFTKLSARPTANESSTGLGLSIVKQLVELHNGTVEIEPTPPEGGAQFLIEIPVSE